MEFTRELCDNCKRLKAFDAQLFAIFPEPTEEEMAKTKTRPRCKVSQPAVRVRHGAPYLGHREATKPTGQLDLNLEP